MFEIINDYGKSALHLKDCLSKDECDRLIEFGKLNPVKKRISSSEVAGGRFLESSAYLTTLNKELFYLLHQRTLEAAKIYLNKHQLDFSLYNFTTTEKEKEMMFYIIKTWKIGGFIGHHRDSYKYSDGSVAEPEISVIVYLTDNFTGGDLILLSADDCIDGKLVNHNENLDQIIKPIAGSMVVLDSRALHKVTPVISGIRISSDRAIHLFE